MIRKKRQRRNTPDKFFGLLKDDLELHVITASEVLERAVKVANEGRTGEVFYVDSRESPVYYSLLFRKIMDRIPFISRLPMALMIPAFGDTAGVAMFPVGARLDAGTMHGLVEGVITNQLELGDVVFREDETMVTTVGGHRVEMQLISRSKALMQYIEVFERLMRERKEEEKRFPHIAVIDPSSDAFAVAKEVLGEDAEFRKFLKENFEEDEASAASALLTIAFKRRADRDNVVAALTGDEVEDEVPQSISVH